MEIKSTPAAVLASLKQPTTKANNNVSQNSTPGVAVELSKEGRKAGVRALSAEQILTKINEALGLEPNQTQTFQDRTPQSTASAIVDGIKGLFSSLEAGIAEDEKAEFVETFFSEARSGINRGYEEAFTALEALGAFQIDGVQSEVEDTRLSIDTQLTQFENEVKERYGLNEQEKPA